MGFLFEAGCRSSHTFSREMHLLCQLIPRHTKPRGSGGGFGSELCYSLTGFPIFLAGFGLFCCFLGFCDFFFFLTWDYCSTSGPSQRISLAREEILSDVHKINQKSNQPLEKSFRWWSHPEEEAGGWFSSGIWCWEADSKA